VLPPARSPLRPPLASAAFAGPCLPCAAHPAHSARPKHPIAGRPQSSSVPPAPRPKMPPPSPAGVATSRAVSPPACHSALLDVIDDDLYPQHAIPFVIHFKGELAEVKLEHRQVMHRAVNDFLQSPVPSFGFAGTLFATEDGFESRHVQQSARAVNEPLIDFVQLPPAFEQKIAAVFQLIAGISVAKARTLLLLAVERKTQAGRIDPAIHHLR